MNKENTEFKSMTVDQLKETVVSLRQQLLGLKLNAATAHIKDYSQFNKLKKNIARALTCLNEKSKRSLK